MRLLVGLAPWVLAALLILILWMAVGFGGSFGAPEWTIR